jgi:hypothetical protein
MEGAEHLTRVTLKGPRSTWHSGRRELQQHQQNNNNTTIGASNLLPKTCTTSTKFLTGATIGWQTPKSTIPQAVVKD